LAKELIIGAKFVKYGRKGNNEKKNVINFFKENLMRGKYGCLKKKMLYCG